MKQHHTAKRNMFNHFQSIQITIRVKASKLFQVRKVKKYQEHLPITNISHFNTKKITEKIKKISIFKQDKDCIVENKLQRKSKNSLKLIDNPPKL